MALAREEIGLTGTIVIVVTLSIMSQFNHMNNLNLQRTVSLVDVEAGLPTPLEAEQM